MTRTERSVVIAVGLMVGSLMVALWRGLDPAFWAGCSLRQLPAQEQRIALFLVLLPVAALVVAITRNVIGLNSFGTFTPALLGLALRETGFWAGLGLLGLIVVPGWWLRHGVENLRLLHVPRAGLVLTGIVLISLGVLLIGNAWDLHLTSAIALMPLIIVMGMIERFWTLEEEDGPARAARTLGETLLIAVLVALVVGIPTVERGMFLYPELLGLVAGVQLVLGRYTGFRVLELYRFRELSGPPVAPGGSVAVNTKRWAEWSLQSGHHAEHDV